MRRGARPGELDDAGIRGGLVTSVLSRPTAAGAAARPRDLRRLDRWFAAVLMPIGPAAVAILRFRLPYSTPGLADRRRREDRGPPRRGALVLWLLVVAFLTAVLLIPGYVALPAVSVVDFIGVTATKPGAAILALLQPIHLAAARRTTTGRWRRCSPVTAQRATGSPAYVPNDQRLPSGSRAAKSVEP